MEGDTAMTSTALGLPTPPCRTRPDQWSESHTNAEAKRLCRQCWRRFTCAADAIKDRSTIWRLQGVVAGVGIPPQNEYGTSKSRRQALNQLHALAAMGQRRPADAIAQRRAESQPPQRTTPPTPTTPAPTPLRQLPTSPQQWARAADLVEPAPTAHKQAC
jgi:WhiB family redox-sensing transcriptional regulator